MRRNLVLVGGGLAAASLLGVAALAALLPGWIEGRLDGLQATASDQLGADITLGGLDVSWWSHFPQVTATATDVRVVNRAPFEGVELFRADELTVQLELTALLADELTVQRVLLRDAAVHLVARGDQANWSLGSDDTTTASGSATTPVDLEQVDLEGLDLRYDSDDLTARVDDLRLSTSGTVTGDAVRFASTVRLGGLTAGSPDGAWVTDLPLDLVLPLDYALDTGAVKLGDVHGTVGTMPVTLKGRATPKGAGWDLDLAFGTPGAELAHLLSLVPHTDADALAKVQASGILALAATVKGAYEGDTYPGATLDLALTGGRIEAAGGPGALTDLDLDLHVSREPGPLDATRVDLRHARWTHLGQPMAVTATVAPPLSAPGLDATAKGRVDLGALDRTLPTDIGWTGLVDLDVAASTRGTAVRDARGRVRAQKLASADLQVPQLDLRLDPKKVTVQALSVRQGATAVDVTGELRDPLAYALGQGPLGGDLAVRSAVVDLRTDPSAPPADDAAPAEVITVPTDLALGVTVDVGRVLYEDYVLTALSGRLAVADGAVAVQSLGFRTLGGKVTLDGTYRAPTPDDADVKGQVQFAELQVDQVMATVDTAAQVVPIAAGAGGRVGGTVNVDTRLGADGGPDLATLFSEGLVLTVGSSLEPDALASAASKLGVGALSTLDLSGTRFDYRIEKGRLTLSPAKVKLGRTPATLGGSAGVVDQTLDLFLDFTLPASQLSGARLDQALPKGVPDVDVRLALVGPYAKPKLKITTGGLDAVKEQGIDKAKEVAGDLIAEASAQGDKLVAEARKAADALVAEADKAAAALVKEAKKQGDKLVKDAKNPVAKVAAEKAADELVKQADKQGDKLVKEAKKQGDQLVATAESQKAKLVADAQKATR